MNNWFTVHQIDGDTYCIEENRHWEQTRCYLLLGQTGALLIDTGLGVGDISAVVRSLTDRNAVAVPTHIHWDHIGGLRYFPEFCCHELELPWLQGQFPLPLESVLAMVMDRSELPAGFSPAAYTIFQGSPSDLLHGGEQIDLGSRRIEVLHTPGHSPGHLCFRDMERGYLFTGDLVYRGTLYANYPSTDPKACLHSLELLCGLPAKRLFPAHYDWDLPPEILLQMRDALRKLNEQGLLCHGTGRLEYDNWSLLL